MKVKYNVIQASLVVALMFAGSATAWSQDEANDLEAAHKIVDRMIEAMGGEEAIKKINSRVMTAKMDMAAQGISMTMTVTQKAPDSVLVDQEIPDLLKMKQGYDGTKGWAKDSIQGIRQLEGAELEELKKQADIHQELNLKEEYPKMKVLPEVEENGKKLHVIEAVSKEGETEKWFFDAESGLLVKSNEAIMMDGEGKVDVEMTASDYREVDGVKVPFKMEVINPAFTFDVTVTSYKHNVDVDNSIFAMPAEDE